MEKTNGNDLQLYIVCEHRGTDNFCCYGILSNGFCFGTHLCSHPSFAPSDLYYRRTERISALESLFGVRFDQGDYIMHVIESKADIPEWWDAQAELQEGLKVKYEEYKTLLASLNKD